MSKERILCSAIHIENFRKYEHQPININSGFVVCGYRHSSCFSLLKIIDDKEHLGRVLKQGFITSHNRFIDREEAKEKFNIEYSEDLY